MELCPLVPAVGVSLERWSIVDSISLTSYNVGEPDPVESSHISPCEEDLA